MNHPFQEASKLTPKTVPTTRTNNGTQQTVWIGSGLPTELKREVQSTEKSQLFEGALEVHLQMSIKGSASGPALACLGALVRERSNEVVSHNVDSHDVDSHDVNRHDVNRHVVNRRAKGGIPWT